ncbi:FAD-dependent oxidoreductase [Aeromicrobium wangtongii]|uniref:FAD-dependent oxidoreductase n=1 Tax=Aeromicrobium wangtongii TaxID=2969247 RepID=A0ABY5M9S4_9ACTN|nr:FAD-dependent oxidoreductase [Aeromicrobium wangtongii]MCD9200153.1 FAD-dependent oxidoreductase [Aeromicrobium wangtongii]UUP13408.1 FAD-dependent oxidoreductase [Aeromicrobium wangtongii]
MIAMVRDLLDRRLGAVTTYRLVTIVLAVLVAVFCLFTATGVIEGLSTGDNLVCLLVLLVASYGSNRLLGLAWRVTPHGESAVITALLLFFLFVPLPSIDTGNLVWLALAAALANASKYVLAWRGRHIFNPAAAGAFLVVVGQDVVGRQEPINAIWQTAATERLFPFVVVGALLVLWRTRRLDVALVFIAVAGVLVGARLLDLAPPGQPFGDVLKLVAYSYPIVFLAGFMLSEPLTLPPRRRQQLVVAAVTGVLFAYPMWIGWFTDTPPALGVFAISPELSLLIGNLVAFALARRTGVTLELETTRRVTPETHELVFRPRRPVRFVPGQYVELTVPHAGADGRGTRRTFSISSPPADDGRVAVMLRVPDRASTFKRALLELEPGSRVHGTGIGGDFVLPADPATPLLLVAGGIGITPFLSQLRHGPDRDVVLVLGVSSAAEVPYADELADVRVVLVCPERPDRLPAAWTFVAAPILSVQVIAEAVPDLAGRHAYVSGPPAMVNAVRPGLARRCRSVRTDYFSGY